MIVEDVITSGGQIAASAKELRALGADIVRVIGVIDREAGGAKNLAEEGLELHALFTMSELKRAALELQGGGEYGHCCEKGNCE